MTDVLQMLRENAEDPAGLMIVRSEHRTVRLL
jgi:hypothetical protein